MNRTHNRIRNIYYMLAYAFRLLNAQKSHLVDTEEFDNMADLCAAMLIHGVSSQIKQGLGKGYVPQTEALSSIRGKIDISASIKSLTMMHQKLVCSYDEFSENTYMNQIVKSTLMLLIRNDIKKDLKVNIRKLLVYFDNVNLIDLHSINWNLHYDRNNQTYRLLISVCYLVVKELLLTESDGSVKLAKFLDDQHMHRLFERFVFEYYRQEYSVRENRLKVSHPQIQWQLDNDKNDFLPVMQTDVMLESQNTKKILIIDAKYYANSMQTYYEKKAIRSGHLYQIYTYVKNKQAAMDTDCEVSGLLLYAKINDDDLCCDYSMGGNRIGVRTLDLDIDFKEIKNQLDKIVTEHLE